MDASVFIEYLLPGKREEECRDLIEDPSTELLVPDLVFAEVANAGRNLAASGHLLPEDSAALLEDLLTLPLASFSTRSLVEDALQHGEALTAYDGCYLVLALDRGCPLATFDRALGAAARSAGAVTPLA